MHKRNKSEKPFSLIGCTKDEIARGPGWNLLYFKCRDNSQQHFDKQEINKFASLRGWSWEVNYFQWMRWCELQFVKSENWLSAKKTKANKKEICFTKQMDNKCLTLNRFTKNCKDGAKWGQILSEESFIFLHLPR